MQPFKIQISEENLQNIYSKVKNYQWHEMPDDGGWDYGTNLNYMKSFSKYWVEKYNWKKKSPKLLSPHFTPLELQSADTKIAKNHALDPNWGRKSTY